MKKEFTFEGKKYKVEGNKAVEIDNNQEQDERATTKFSASQSKSNKRDMGNSAPADLKELKTLKDLKSIATPMNNLVSKQDLKELVIKWIKEERNIKKELCKGWLQKLTQEERWMKRLNITEEDLK